MFDGAYFEALRTCQGTIGGSLAGTEKFRDGDTCPIVPGCLTPELRARWIEEFTALTSYALENGLGTEEDLPQSSMQSLLSDAIRNLEKVASPPRKAHKPPTALSPTSDSSAQHDANKQLYQTNKELASANTAMEVKLSRMRTTLASLTAKIEYKTGEKAVATDPVERASAALRLLFVSDSANDNKNKGRLWLILACFQSCNRTSDSDSDSDIGLHTWSTYAGDGPFRFSHVTHR